MIRFFDMFSGIGGFRAGLERAGGYKCVGHCEIDAFANRSYNAVFDTENEVFFDDATKINPKDIPDFDILCAGFPCQAFSVAGRRRGFEDARGTLIFEIVRVLGEKRPNIFYLKMFPVCLTMTKGGLLRKSSLRYQTWGMVSNGRCLTARISVFPKPGKECTLSDILTKDVPEKYYLSQSATLRLLSKSLAEIRDKECTTPKDSE